MDVLDFVFLTIFFNPSIPLEPDLFSLVVFLVDNFIVFRAHFLKAVGHFGGEAPNNIFFRDRGWEDRYNDRFFTKATNPLDIGLEH